MYVIFSLNRTTTSISTKVKPTLNSSKVGLKVNSGLKENVSNIPKAVTKPKPVGLVKTYQKTLTRSSSLRNRSVSRKLINTFSLITTLILLFRF